jgi:hypothetical protein
MTFGHVCSHIGPGQNCETSSKARTKTAQVEARRLVFFKPSLLASCRGGGGTRLLRRVRQLVFHTSLLALLRQSLARADHDRRQGPKPTRRTGEAGASFGDASQRREHCPCRLLARNGCSESMRCRHDTIWRSSANGGPKVPPPDKTCGSWKKRSRSSKAGTTHETKTGAAGGGIAQLHQNRRTLWLTCSRPAPASQT